MTEIMDLLSLQLQPDCTMSITEGGGRMRFHSFWAVTLTMTWWLSCTKLTWRFWKCTHILKINFLGWLI